MAAYVKDLAKYGNLIFPPQKLTLFGNYFQNAEVSLKSITGYKLTKTTDLAPEYTFRDSKHNCQLTWYVSIHCCSRSASDARRISSISKVSWKASFPFTFIPFSPELLTVNPAFLICRAFHTQKYCHPAP